MFWLGRIALVLCFVYLLTCSTGCQDVARMVGGAYQEFDGMFDLRQEIVDEYGEEDVEVTVTNGSAITVTFVNSSFNDLSSFEQERKAGEIAEFVTANYERSENLQGITVTFAVIRDYVIFDYSNTLDTYCFDAPMREAAT